MGRSAFSSAYSFVPGLNGCPDRPFPLAYRSFCHCRTSAYWPPGHSLASYCQSYRIWPRQNSLNARNQMPKETNKAPALSIPYSLPYRLILFFAYFAKSIMEALDKISHKGKNNNQQDNLS